jgi:hypothetical protein
LGSLHCQFSDWLSLYFGYRNFSQTKYACEMRKFLSFGVVLVFSFVSAVVPADAAVKVGDSCKSAGQTTTVNGSRLICTKSGSKLSWSIVAKADGYDAAFARAYLAEAKKTAAKILSDAKLTAEQMSKPPYCSTGNSRAYASIGGDPSTGLKALFFDNPGVCDLEVRATASFLCPDGKVQKVSNVVSSSGTFTLKAGQSLKVSYNIPSFFPQVLTDCRNLTRYASSTVNISTFHQAPRVSVVSSRFTGAFNKALATKKADQFLKSESARAEKIVNDAKNPKLIAAAWRVATVAAAQAAAEAAAREIAEAPARAAAAKEAANAAARAALDAGRGQVCIPETSCPLGSIGPGNGMVFYDAGSQQSWGRYLEVARDGWSGSAIDPKSVWCETLPDGGFIEFLENQGTTSRRSTLSREIGTGISNTNLILTKCTSGAAVVARAYQGGGKTDWSLPSMGEFSALIDYQVKNGWLYKGYDVYDTRHHTSTELTYHYSLGFWIQSEFGNPFSLVKNELKFVRPFRAF